MKTQVYIAVSVNERLPKIANENYLTISEKGFETARFFNGVRFESAHFEGKITHWLEKQTPILPSEDNKQFKHTPGEWNIDINQPNTVSVHSPWGKENDVNNSETFGDYRGSFICEMHYNNGVPSKRQAIRNAQLISAAPNMLDALIKIKDYVTRECSAIHRLPDNQIDYILKDVNVAIKKATQ